MSTPCTLGGRDPDHWTPFFLMWMVVIFGAGILLALLPCGGL